MVKRPAAFSVFKRPRTISLHGVCRLLTAAAGRRVIPIRFSCSAINFGVFILMGICRFIGRFLQLDGRAYAYSESCQVIPDATRTRLLAQRHSSRQSLGAPPGNCDPAFARRKPWPAVAIAPCREPAPIARRRWTRLFLAKLVLHFLPLFTFLFPSRFKSISSRIGASPPMLPSLLSALPSHADCCQLGNSSSTPSPPISTARAKAPPGPCGSADRRLADRACDRIAILSKSHALRRDQPRFRCPENLACGSSPASQVL
jgi:hypothetical protein